MNVFLKELSKEYKDDIILIICGGAAWHKSNRLCQTINKLTKEMVKCITHRDWIFNY